MTAVGDASLRDLAGLVNKSLLTFDIKYGRYHIHNLLRQFAAAQTLFPQTLAQAQERGKTSDLWQTAESLLQHEFKQS